MSDELRGRLARLDPMHTGVPTEPTTSESSRQLVEKIMSTQIEEQRETTPGGPGRRWTMPIAAAAALVLAVAGAIAFTGGEEAPTAQGPPLLLTAAGENSLASCIAFSAEELGRMTEVAFAGTVTNVDGPTVTLTVDHWYRGGDAAQVVLDAPQGLEALIGGVAFETGSEYLITAQSGTVNYCGFSGPATPDYRAAFDTAFAQG